MRLVRQYEPDKAYVAGRLLLVSVFIATMYALLSTTAGVFAHNYFDASQERDEALLEKTAHSDMDQDISTRIAKREALLAKIQNKAAAMRLRRQLAVLYDREGNESERERDRTSAEMYFRKASELDPGNSTYYFDTAQLYANDAVEQRIANNRVELYRNSVDLYGRALDREQDPYRKQRISNEAASASYDLAKTEFIAPEGKNLAVADLLRAKQWVTPGSQTAADIDQLFLLASN